MNMKVVRAYCVYVTYTQSIVNFHLGMGEKRKRETSTCSLFSLQPVLRLTQLQLQLQEVKEKISQRIDFGICR